MCTPETYDKQIPYKAQPKLSWMFSNYFAWGLFCLALFVRFFYLYEIRHNPFFNTPMIDAHFHDVWAKQLVAGDWASSAQGVFLRPPLYSYFMAIIYKIFGHNYLILRLIQLTMGAVSCWFIYLLGRDYFSKRVGLIAFILAALYGTFIYFEGEFLMVNLHIFLNLLLLLLLSKANKRDNVVWWLLSGFTLGLSALTVPTVLLLLPFLLLWLYLEKYKSGQRFWLPVFLIVLSTLFTIAPVTIHNYRHGDGFTLISANGGINFYLGNNLDADKTVAIRPGIIWDRLVVQPHLVEGSILNEAEADRYWVKETVKFIRDYPTSFAKLLLKKLGRFWQAHEIKRTQDIYFFKRYSYLLSLPLVSFGLVAPLALLGLGLAWYKGHRDYLLFFYLLTIMLGVILFFVTARYRLPVVPVLIIFAAYFVDWLWEKIREQNYRKTSYAIVLVLVLTGIINYDFSDVEASNKFNFARSHHNLGFVYHRNRDWRRAINEWEKALDLYALDDPNIVDTYLFLANTYFHQAGDHQKAIEYYQEGLKILPNAPELESRMGWVYYKQGLVEKGIETLKKAQRSNPLSRGSYLKLAQIYIQEKDFDELQQMQQQASDVFKKRGSKDKTLSLLADIYLKQGLLEVEQKNQEAAEILLQMVLEIDSESELAFRALKRLE